MRLTLDDRAKRKPEIMITALALLQNLRVAFIMYGISDREGTKRLTDFGEYIGLERGVLNVIIFHSVALFGSLLQLIDNQTCRETCLFAF